MRLRVAALIGLAVCGCGKSTGGGDQGGGGGGDFGGKVPEGTAASVDYETINGQFITVNLSCIGQSAASDGRTPGTQFRIRDMPGSYTSAMCFSDKAKFNLPVTGYGMAPAQAVLKIDATPPKGEGYTVLVPMVPSSYDTAGWLKEYFKIVPPEGQAATPGVRLWVDKFMGGDPQIVDGKLRFQVVVPAGAEVKIDDQAVAWTNGAKQVTTEGHRVDGGVFTETFTSDMSTGAVELTLDPALLDAPIETARTEVDLPAHKFEFASPGGKYSGELKGQIRVVEAARGVDKGPVWFVNKDSKPAKNGVYLTTDGSPGWTFGKGKLSELGVVVTSTEADSQAFSPCKYQGGYSVTRRGFNVNAKAFDPRTGKVLGETKIKAKAPACPDAIGVNASTPAVQGSGSDVDATVVEKWALSLVK